MAAAILTNGLTAFLAAISATITYVAITDDSTAFAVGQTVINPAGGSTTTLTKAATTTAVNATTVNKTITINGTTEFTGKSIFAIGLAKGALTTGTGTDLCTRSVRGASTPIGVQAGDAYTMGGQLALTDQS